MLALSRSSGDQSTSVLESQSLQYISLLCSMVVGRKGTSHDDELRAASCLFRTYPRARWRLDLSAAVCLSSDGPVHYVLWLSSHRLCRLRTPSILKLIRCHFERVHWLRLHSSPLARRLHRTALMPLYLCRLFPQTPTAAMSLAALHNSWPESLLSFKPAIPAKITAQVLTFS